MTEADRFRPTVFKQVTPDWQVADAARRAAKRECRKQQMRYHTERQEAVVGARQRQIESAYIGGNFGFVIRRGCLGHLAIFILRTAGTCPQVRAAARLDAGAAEPLHCRRLRRALGGVSEAVQLQKLKGGHGGVGRTAGGR